MLVLQPRLTCIGTPAIQVGVWPALIRSEGIIAGAGLTASFIMDRRMNSSVHLLFSGEMVRLAVLDMRPNAGLGNARSSVRCHCSPPRWLR